MSAKEKGASGEREACEWLHRKLYGRNVGLERNLSQSRSGGADIIHHPFVFEVKRRKRSERNLSYDSWWIQVTKATKEQPIDLDHRYWLSVVMFRIDKGDWQFLISAEHMGCSQGWLHVNAIRFCEWAKAYAEIV